VVEITTNSSGLFFLEYNESRMSEVSPAQHREWSIHRATIGVAYLVIISNQMFLMKKSHVADVLTMFDLRPIFDATPIWPISCGWLYSRTSWLPMAPKLRCGTQVTQTQVFNVSGAQRWGFIMVYLPEKCWDCGKMVWYNLTKMRIFHGDWEYYLE